LVAVVHVTGEGREREREREREVPPAPHG
jgi:hypothetical protein